MVKETQFKVVRIDVLAAGDDDVLHTIAEPKETVFVEAPDIAGAEVGVAIAVVPENLGRHLGGIEIAVHHIRGTGDDLAEDAGGDRLAGGVDDLHLGADAGLADGSQLVRKCRAIEDRRSAAFRKTVNFDQTAGKAVQYIAFEGGPERGAGR